MEILGQQDVSAIYLPFKTMLNTFRYCSYQFNTLGLFFLFFFFPEQFWDNRQFYLRSTDKTLGHNLRKKSCSSTFITSLGQDT